MMLSGKFQVLMELLPPGALELALVLAVFVSVIAAIVVIGATVAAGAGEE